MNQAIDAKILISQIVLCHHKVKNNFNNCERKSTYISDQNSQLTHFFFTLMHL